MGEGREGHQTTERAQDSDVAPAIAPPPTIGDLLEVRLAIVLYGGVSLAIYMNGVAQELFRLVRATAPRGVSGDGATSALPEDQLGGSEKVYRIVGQLLEDDDRLPTDIKPEDPILRRFVIDIISGSSAGGINGVFLAKALATDKAMDRLTDLWLHEGDIAKLINDRGSLEGNQLRKVKGPPQSLLSGRRMYRKLLEAFDGMDGSDRQGRSNSSTASPYVDQLDLYVTATDLQGLRLPIRLANGVVVEQRHRNVFHFRYATAESGEEPRNDFQADNNPFLAFAARCTSAFPFAFDPMVLSRIDDDLKDFPFYKETRFEASSRKWEEFYADYLDSDRDLNESTGEETPETTIAGITGGMPFKDRQFGDGGSLDNKPFTWATGELLRRRADNPVDRKLIFVEPDPHTPKQNSTVLGPTDSVLAQAVLLPREETVRDDLQAVLDRNRIIQRLDSVLLSVESRLDPTEINDPKEFTKYTIQEEAEVRGASYGAYRTLRVESVTDDLAELYAWVLGYPRAPGYIRAIRYLVECWRLHRFPDRGAADERGKAPAGTTLTSFLFIYDIQYRLRRLNLVKRKIDHVFPMREAPDVARPILAAAGLSHFWPPKRSEAEKLFQKELLRLKKLANEIDHLHLQKFLSHLRPRIGTVEESSFRNLARGLPMHEATLKYILEGRNQIDRRARAEELFSANYQAFQRLAGWLEENLRPLFSDASALWESQLDSAEPPPNEPQQTARTLLRLTYERFEAYDTVAFPMLYGANVGEADVVDIIRISPPDATGLRDVEEPGSKPKVAGARFGHFGAFLRESWRKNDILWGRLDAAEILIQTLVPQQIEPAHRQKLVGELRERAQASIIREYFTAEQRKQVVGELMTGLATESDLPPVTDGDSVAAAVAARGGTEAMQTLARTLVNDDQQLVKAFRDEYQVSMDLPVGPMAKTLGRGIHVTGQVLRSSAEEGRNLAPLKSPAMWIGRLGQMLAGVAEAAIPGSWAHILFRHLLALLYLFEAAVFAVSLLFLPAVAKRWAVTAFVLTLAANFAFWVIGVLIRGRKWGLLAIAALVSALIGLLIWLAWLELVHLGQQSHFGWIPFFGKP